MVKPLFLVSMLLLSCLIIACTGSDSPTATPTPEIIATPDTAIEPPPTPVAEEPLQGVVVEIPEIWIVPSLQSKQALAAYLKTTVEQLDWVNPGLDDPVPPGAFVAIPASYRVSAGESLSAIATLTGLPEDLLRAANPKLSAAEPLPDGTVLAVPHLVIMVETTSLEQAAASLNLSGETLLAANQNLVGIETVDAGMILVLPPTGDAP